MDDQHEWKSIAAAAVPFSLVMIGCCFAAVFCTSPNDVEIERLKLAQMQYQAEWKQESQKQKGTP